MLRPTLIRPLVAAGSLVALAAGLPAQTFTTYGQGCPGTAGLPAIGHQGLPVLGTKFGIDLANATPTAPAFLLLGYAQQSLNLAFVGAPLCTLLVTPDVTLASATSGTGAARASFAIPADPQLSGARLYAQWGVLDPGATNPFGLTLSDGGCLQVGNLPPLSIVPNSITVIGNGEVGTRVTVRLLNAGTTDPADLCFLMMAGNPAVGTQIQSRLRVTSIVKDPLTGEELVTARLATVAGPHTPLQWQLGLMRGAGGTPSVPASGALGPAVAPWGWNGFGLPGNGTMGPSPFQPQPSPTRQSVLFLYDATAGNESLYADLPAYPFGNGGLYPKDAQVTSDAHGDLNCNGPSSMHFDKFLEGVPVVTPNVTAQTIADDHAPQIQAVFDHIYGAGKFLVTAEAGARLRIKAIGAGCTLTGGGGSVVITKP